MFIFGKLPSRSGTYNNPYFTNGKTPLENIPFKNDCGEDVRFEKHIGLKEPAYVTFSGQRVVFVEKVGFVYLEHMENILKTSAYPYRAAYLKPIDENSLPDPVLSLIPDAAIALPWKAVEREFWKFITPYINRAYEWVYQRIEVKPKKNDDSPSLVQV